MVFTVWPVLTLATAVIDGRTVGDTLRIPGLARVLWFTTWQAAASTALTMVVGVVPAYLLHRFEFRWRTALRAALIVPFFLPTVVVAAAFLALLPSGLHDSPAALIAAHVFLNVAVVVQIVGAMWEVVPGDLTAAVARAADQRRFESFCHATDLVQPRAVDQSCQGAMRRMNGASPPVGAGNWMPPGKLTALR